ncbi:MAG: hypothetical protein JWO22_3954, partial [Frankiales bacterium]|nr:hypothetical protein [Frankiales bacterium]
HAGLKRGDIDHYLVGPGGLFIIETKWSGAEWSLERADGFLVNACQQVTAAASTVELSLDNRHRIPAQPVLVLWGAASAALDITDAGIARTGPVLVIDGTKVRDWVLRLPRNILEPATIADAHGRMAAQVVRRDAAEPPTTRSMGSMALRAMVNFVLAWFAFYVPALIGTWLGTLGAIVAALLQFGLAVLARQLTRRKLQTTVVAAGSLGLIAFVVAYEVFAWAS